MQKLDDFTIREAFKTFFAENRTETLIDEVDLIRGKSRVDLIYYGNFITGYEIKSDKDSLLRLSTQTQTYNQSLEKIVLICGTTHTEELIKELPAWWGLIEAKYAQGKIVFRDIRKPKLSPHFNHIHLLDILWKEELETIIQTYELSNYRHKSKYELKNIIKSISPYFELKELITNLLSLRSAQKLAPKRKQHGD